MRVLSWVVQAAAILTFLANLRGFRMPVRAGVGVSAPSTMMLFMLFASIILVYVLTLSPFHLLWMVPTSLVAGLLCIVVFPRPSSIVYIPAWLFGRVCCIGTGWSIGPGGLARRTLVSASFAASPFTASFTWLCSVGAYLGFGLALYSLLFAHAPRLAGQRVLATVACVTAFYLLEVTDPVRGELYAGNFIHRLPRWAALALAVVVMWVATFLMFPLAGSTR